MPEIATVILVSGILLLLGIVSNKLSARIGVPVLLLFLVVGMLAGSEGIGGIDFEDYSLANAIGTVALCLILFDSDDFMIPTMVAILGFLTVCRKPIEKAGGLA